MRWIPTVGPGEDRLSGKKGRSLSHYRFSIGVKVLNGHRNKGQKVYFWVADVWTKLCIFLFLLRGIHSTNYQNQGLTPEKGPITQTSFLM